MQITHVETYPVEIPIKPERRMISSLGQHMVSRYLLVRVLTDDGLEGAGEATVTARWSGETVWSAQSIDRARARAGGDRLRSDRRRRNRSPDGRRGLRTTGSPRARSRWPAGTFAARPPASRSTNCWAEPSGRWPSAAATAWAPTSPSGRAAERGSWSPPASRRSRSRSAATPQRTSRGCARCARPSAPTSR